VGKPLSRRFKFGGSRFTTSSLFSISVLADQAVLQACALIPRFFRPRPLSGSDADSLCWPPSVDRRNGDRMVPSSSLAGRGRVPRASPGCRDRPNCATHYGSKGSLINPPPGGRFGVGAVHLQFRSACPEVRRPAAAHDARPVFCQALPYRLHPRLSGPHFPCNRR